MIQTFPQPPVENSHVPVSEPAETYPTPSRTLNESFTSPNRQNISDVSFSNPQTPINTSTMSPITPGSQTRFIENKFLNLNSLIESRRAELEALKKRNQASYSVVTGSSTQKSIIADDHHTKQLESDVKMWSSKYKDEKNKSEKLETKIVDLTKQVYEFNQHILSMQSKESSNNLYMEEEIKMWSAKYEEEKKRSNTLELQLKTMSDQFDEHDKNFQTLRAMGTDSIQGELAAELEQQVEELTNERDDLLDEADSLRSQLNSRIARIRELESNEFITKLQHEIDQLKQSLSAANSKLQSIPENLEDLMKENIELRGRLEMSEESRKKLEMLEGLRPQNNSQATMADADTNTDVNANINNNALSNTNTNEVANNWEQEKEELIKQWTMQANDWTAMEKAMQTDLNKYYEHCLFMDAEASKFKVIAEEKEGERNAYKEELDHLKEQSLASASVPNINQDVFNTKIKEMEMNMAQKWVGLLVRRKKSFLLRRSFDIMRLKVAEKSTVGLVQPSKESAPPITGNGPSRGIGPPISNMYPSNNNLPPAQELRFRGKSNLTAEEDKQLQSDFDLIKQLQGSDKVVVTEKQDNIYNLMSSIFYKIIIWLLLIIIAFLYIKSCRIQSSSRPVRLTS
jgi:predicted  nucleic acid-binding Zn-ribbon protein